MIKWFKSFQHAEICWRRRAGWSTLESESETITITASVSKCVDRATSLLPTKAFLSERDGATLLLKEFEHP